MTTENFHNLLTILRPYITKQQTSMSDSITAEEKLFITLRFLATGIVLTLKRIVQRTNCGDVY